MNDDPVNDLWIKSPSMGILLDCLNYLCTKSSNLKHVLLKILIEQELDAVRNLNFVNNGH